MKKNLPTVVMDVDNTLVPMGFSISEENKTAIEEYTKRGGRIVFATGKVPAALYELIDLLHLEDTYHMGGNGAILFNLAKNDFRELCKLGKDSGPIIQAMYDKDIEGYFYYKDRINVTGENVNSEEIKQLVSIGEPNPILNNNIDCSLVMKILLFIDIKEVEKEAYVRESLTPLLKDFHFIRTGNHLLEIHHKDQTKGNALKEFIKIYDIELEDIYAIGDSENDLSMLEVVGHPYIVSNSSEMVKERINNVLPSDKENGVATLLWRLMEN